MINSNCIQFESLDRRVLLSHVGLDLSFGGVGYAAADGTVLVAPAQGGKVLAVGPDGAVRLNADGSLDASFVDRGARTEADRTPQTATVREQKLFVAGAVSNATGTAGIFVRKTNLSTGTVDSSFGQSGVATFAPEIAVENARVIVYSAASLIATADGGVIVAVRQLLSRGNYPNETVPEAIVLHKFTAAGVLDTAFGNDGVVTAELLEDDYLATAQISAYADGQFIVLAGVESDPTMKRFNADGSLDTTFGDNGVVALAASPFNFSDARSNAVVVQPDGKLLVPYMSTDITGENSFSWIRRFNADGSADTSFGENGAAKLGPEQGGYVAPDIALDAAGRILTIARGEELCRLTTAGVFDESFDDDGITPIPRTAEDGHLGGAMRGRLAIDAAGNVLMAQAGRVARFADGQDVAALGSDGIVRIDGTNAADLVTATVADESLTVIVNSQVFTFAAGGVVGFLVTGADGNDTIDLAGADFPATVNAGKGNDFILTGNGDDWINCDVGNETVDAGGGKDLILGDDGNDSISAGAGNDIVFGEYGEDVISGGDGNDRLYGGHTELIEDGEYTSGDDGDDTISGNAGNDTIDGGRGNDRVAGNGGRDRLFAGDGYSDRVYGGAGGDWLYGQGGNDQLFGEGGNDRLYDDDFEFGMSTLHGGAGNDTFVTRDGAEDVLFGDGGHDIATVDSNDRITSIEELA